MNQTNYKVMSKEVPFHTIEVTRSFLWENYMRCWAELASELKPGSDFNSSTEHLKTVHAALCDEKVDARLIRRLFSIGDTMMLMGDAMKFIDTGKPVLVEIVVVDDTNCRVVIRHKDINY